MPDPADDEATTEWLSVLDDAELPDPPERVGA